MVSEFSMMTMSMTLLGLLPKLNSITPLSLKFDVVAACGVTSHAIVHTQIEIAFAVLLLVLVMSL